jgi:hypothetical protein
MRDTSAWTGNPYTSKPYVALTVRQRYPNFHWRNGNTVYALPGLGEDWGDSPGTVTEIRERDLPSRYRYGGFAVLGDSVTLSNGNILRVTSLRAGNQGNDVWWKEISTVEDLTTKSTLTFTNSPRVWTGVGLAAHSTPTVARMFYIRGSDNKLVYQDFTSGIGFGTVYAYSNSPTFNLDGVAIAPVSHDEGFVIAYNPASFLVTLYHFQAGAWTSYAIPMRYSQHPLNCHWFDAVSIPSSQSLVTFNVNGVQYATIYTGDGLRDPWPIMAFDTEFGGAQTRICKLTKVGERAIATAWSRFAGSGDDYEVSYYHLLWSDNYVHWAMPEEGYIGQMACRGKLHTTDNTAYIVGASTSHVGDATNWLGGTAGTYTTMFPGMPWLPNERFIEPIIQNTTVGRNVLGHNLIQDLDKASDAKLPLLIPDNFDKSLLTYGNELIYGIGLVGESAIPIATLTLDTPGNALEADKQTMEMVCRGPLKRLIAAHTPMDQTFSGTDAYHADFTVGSLYARAGTWSHETAGVAYCERHEGSEAVATVGVQYGGQFQISSRVRVTQTLNGAAGGVIFWYEGPQDYYRFQLSGSQASLRQYKAGVETVLASAAVTGGLQAGVWYDILLTYRQATVQVFMRPAGGAWQQVIDFADWTEPEPLRWYAGLFCVLPSAKTTQSLSLEATHKVDVNSTTGFPTTGEIKLNGEIIAYNSKTSVQFGTGQAYSLIRGVRSTRASHPENSPVTVAGQRFEADRFSIFQDGLPLSVSAACSHIITMAGVPFEPSVLINNSTSGNRVFPELHGHGWVLNGIGYDVPFSMSFWTDTENPPQSGIKVQISATEAVISDIVGGEIMRYPISIPAAGLCRFRVETNSIFFWVNGRLIVAFHVPGKVSSRVGAVACDGGVINLVAQELFEPAEGVTWGMKESAREVLQRLLEGRDAYLRERSDGAVQVTLLEKRDNLGELSGQYFVSYQRAAADQEWASAMIAWGAEEWVLVMEPDADRLRWTQWQTPHIYDRTTLRHRAMRRLRKLWALRDLRVLRGPFDPRIEVGDEVTIASIRGIPAGRYLVRSVEVVGEPTLLDMKLTVQALPDDLTVATWPIQPGIDRPSEGT